MERASTRLPARSKTESVVADARGSASETTRAPATGLGDASRTPKTCGLPSAAHASSSCVGTLLGPPSESERIRRPVVKLQVGDQGLVPSGLVALTRQKNPAYSGSSTWWLEPVSERS